MATQADEGGVEVARIQPAYQQVAQQLRSAILSGELQPGDRLPVEGDLATLFGVSRSTVREALRLLASQDLVHTRRGVSGGTFVSDVDPGTLSHHLETGIGLLSGTKAVSVRNLLEARAMLEVPAARLAAERRTETDIERLRACVADESDLGDRQPEFEPHETFHMLVLDCTDNTLLGIMTRPIFEVLRTRFLRDSAPRRFWTRVNTEHAEIAQRIIDGDGDGAADAMERHLRRLESTYIRIARPG